jgi:hypothetical protein
MGQSFGWDRKKTQSPVSQQVWHDKDPSLLRFYVLKWDILKTTTTTGVPIGKFRMGRKSNYLMERVYAHLSKNSCRKSGLLADPELTDTLFLSDVLRNKLHWILLAQIAFTNVKKPKSWDKMNRVGSHYITQPPAKTNLSSPELERHHNFTEVFFSRSWCTTTSVCWPISSCSLHDFQVFLSSKKGPW